MRRSPRRPLILKRRKLPFQLNEPAPADPVSQAAAPAKPPASQCFPDGVRVIDHPSMPDTQVVVVPNTADLQSVIDALTAKGKECGIQGPNKFILLSEGSSWDSVSVCQGDNEAKKTSAKSTFAQPVKEETVHSPDVTPLTGIKPLNRNTNCGPLDDSLTNIQWLDKMSTCGFEPNPAKQMSDKENQHPASQNLQALSTNNDAESAQQPMSERPPYSYMAMIQFAINSKQNRTMTLKEIYMWIEEHFPYYREVAKPGWKNSIRHNLSLHDMFIREMSPDGKVSFWTIRPEANRCLTLDQVYKPGCDPMTAPISVPMLLFPQQQKRMVPDARKTPTSSERRMKPLLPRTDSYLVPIQLPVTSSLYLPSSSASFTPIGSQQKQSASRGIKRVRIAPKGTQSNSPAVATFPQTTNSLKVEVKEKIVCVPAKCETPKAPPRRQASSSRRKQHLVRSVTEEPVLLCPNNTFFDFGVASDASIFQEVRDYELDENRCKQDSPERGFFFKTPIKSSSHLTSSTPSPSVAPESWKVTQRHHCLFFCMHSVCLQALSTNNDAESAQQPMSERPPYSYMAMIQFAINSKQNRTMTLKEIYMWIEEHFPYYREVAKPGWKNSIRHNLSLHDMFIREMSPDGKVSFWTIRPEANRCLTLDQVYKPGCDPMTAPISVPMLPTPVGKGSQNVLDVSPIRAPGGLAVTPRHDYTTYSFSSTPFKDLPLFGSPRELLTLAPPRATGPAESPMEPLQSSCFRELLQAGNTTPANRSITEGLVLDTMNDSLSKILGDISFPGLDDEDLGTANISWSKLISQLK